MKNEAAPRYYVFDVHTSDPPVFSTRWRWLAHCVAWAKGGHFDFGDYNDAYPPLWDEQST